MEEKSQNSQKTAEELMVYYRQKVDLLANRKIEALQALLNLAKESKLQKLAKKIKGKL